MAGEREFEKQQTVLRFEKADRATVYIISPSEEGSYTMIVTGPKGNDVTITP